MEKTKLRLRLEDLKKGGSMRVKGVTSSKTGEYSRAQSTVHNLVLASGWQFTTTLAAGALIIKRTK